MTTSVRAVLQDHYRRHGFDGDGGESRSHWTMLRVGRLGIVLPNFSWRRQALACHDLHHALTGYPCTVVGECQMAAWEFAAGPYPDVRARLFCLPLVALGAVAAPRATYAAYVRGRRSATLYAGGLTEDVLGLEIDALRARHVPQGEVRADRRDVLGWSGLVLRSILLTIAPWVAIAAIGLALT